MKFLQLFAVLSTIVLIAACASAPEVTLKPSDVPSLYGDFSTIAVEQTAAVASGPEVHASLGSAQAGVENAMQQTASDAVAKVEQSTESLKAEQCAAIREEIDALDGGLGGPAEDSEPEKPRSTSQKTGKALFDMGSQTLMGPVQIFIQTKRALFGDAEKERLRAEALERGNTRRAYLLGYASALGCE